MKTGPMPGKYQAVMAIVVGETIEEKVFKWLGGGAHTKVIHRNGRKSRKLWVQAKFRLDWDCYRGLITQLHRAGPTGEPRLIICSHVGFQCPSSPDGGGDMCCLGWKLYRHLRSTSSLKGNCFAFVKLVNLSQMLKPPVLVKDQLSTDSAFKQLDQGRAKPNTSLVSTPPVGPSSMFTLRKDKWFHSQPDEKCRHELGPEWQYSAEH